MNCPISWTNAKANRAKAWVHGTKEELKEYSTNGCIVLTNGDLVQLDPCIRIWDSPIIVEDTLRPEICNPQSSITPRDLSIE